MLFFAVEPPARAAAFFFFCVVPAALRSAAAFVSAAHVPRRAARAAFRPIMVTRLDVVTILLAVDRIGWACGTMKLLTVAAEKARTASVRSFMAEVAADDLRLLCANLGNSDFHNFSMPLSAWSRCADVIAEYPAGASELAQSTTIVTGPTAGIGVETARWLASLGGRTVLAARNLDKAAAVASEIRRTHPQAQISAIQCDLVSLASVSQFVDEFRKQSAAEGWPPLKCIVLNAGVITMTHRLTEDGFEETFAVSHLAHWLLATLLLPELKAAAPSRVVLVSSGSHLGPHATRRVASIDALRAHVAQPDGRGWGLRRAILAYGSAKLCNATMAHAIDAKFCASDGVAACSLHPGTMMATRIGRESRLVDFLMRSLLAPFTKDMDQGSSTTLACCLAPHASLGGRFFADCKPTFRSKLVDDDAAEALWALSAELCGRT